jgi:hypothetical protein
MQNRLAAIIIFFIIFIPFQIHGQKLVNSPFGRFNLGAMEPAGSFRSIGMGGIATAVRDNSSIYFSNPASYSSLDTNSFVFDFGLDYGINILSDGSTRHFSDDINFDHLLIGFPIARRWGVAAGIIPVSNGYYSISQMIKKGDSEYDPLIGEYTEYHFGDGSISDFFMGTGINFTKNFSAGINMTLLFGSLNRVNQFTFADYRNTYQDNSTETFRISGLNLDYGLQYNASLKKDFFINLGASMSNGKNYKSKFEKLAFRYNYYGAKDTLFYTSDNSTKAHLPGTIRMGLSFGKKNKFVAGFDYIMTKWSEAKFHGSEGYLGDTRSMLLGVEYIPDKFSNYSFLKRMEYRVGCHIEDNYLVIDGEQIKETGISIGFGIPMRRSLSKTNVFFDFTRRSGASERIHKENCITMGVSLNLYDRWFIKRKYD